MIGIVDYGMGNIHSVRKALECMGAKTLVTGNPRDILDCDKLVLPGVGAFGDAMRQLENQNLVLAIKDFIRQGKIFLGICLGMHLLFQESEESPKIEGLGIIKGVVKRFQDIKGFKVPHIGWNELKKSKIRNLESESECPILKGISDNSFVYFCHSYYPEPNDETIVAATTSYATVFTSVIWQDTIYGVQFHPEKSQAVGLALLKNFVLL